ncbi:MAG TPA: AAA family ATPase, partial [Verrucomicrobiae bacterium]|nr:AAA family ATPase [Verrucomicrobiae bacterium]
MDNRNDLNSGFSISDQDWPTCRQADIPCALCGRKGNCTVSPDRKIFQCLVDDDEEIDQTQPSDQPGELDLGGPVLISLADVTEQNVQWLWPGKMPLGRITLLVGRAGEGKSLLTTDLAARVTTGAPWPDGSPCPQGSVIFVSTEDGSSDTIKPRCLAHHADCGK